METLDAWAQNPDAKAKLATAKKSMWATFTKQFLNADKNKFMAQPKCFAKKGQGHFNVCSVQTFVTGARK